MTKTRQHDRVILIFMAFTFVLTNLAHSFQSTLEADGDKLVWAKANIWLVEIEGHSQLAYKNYTVEFVFLLVFVLLAVLYYRSKIPEKVCITYPVINIIFLFFGKSVFSMAAEYSMEKHYSDALPFLKSSFTFWGILIIILNILFIVYIVYKYYLKKSLPTDNIFKKDITHNNTENTADRNSDNNA